MGGDPRSSHGPQVFNEGEVATILRRERPDACAAWKALAGKTIRVPEMLGWMELNTKNMNHLLKRLKPPQTVSDLEVNKVWEFMRARTDMPLEVCGFIPLSLFLSTTKRCCSTVAPVPLYHFGVVCHG